MTEAGHFKNGAWIPHICKTCRRFSKLPPQVNINDRYGKCEIPHFFTGDDPIVRDDEHCGMWE